MSQTALNFIVTTAGYNQYTSIIGSGGKVTFGTVSVGDAGSGTYTPPTQATTALTDAKDTSSVSLLEPIPGESAKIRVNAMVPQNSSGGTYSINEIGLFIQDISGSTLFAIYGSSTSITQKNPLSDLLLDFIIDLEGFDLQNFQTVDDQSAFSCPSATQTTAGIVQLATFTDAQQEIPNRVLTADLLGQGPFIAKSCMKDTWIAAGKLTQPISSKIQPTGVYYDQTDTITLFCSNVDEKPGFIGIINYSMSQGSFTYYDCQDGGVVVEDYPPNAAQNIQGQDPLNGTWLFTSLGGLFGEIVLNQGTVADGSVPIDYVGDFTALIYHNHGYVYLFGGTDGTTSNTVIGSYNVSSKAYVNNCGNTKYNRSSPLLQVVDNKIYCFGGNDPTKDGYASNVEVIEIASDNTLHSISNFRLFPLSLANVTTSAISGHDVYLFQPKRYYTNFSGADLNFYRFDLRTNIFETLTMPSSTILPGGSNVSPTNGLAVACGQGRICLINTYYDSSSSSAVFNAFMYTPSA